MTLFICAAVLFPVMAVIPAEAQYTGWAEASITPTPTLSPEPTETSVPEEYYMPKIFVPTNTPQPMDAVQIIPNPEDREICEIAPIPECDRENLPIDYSDTTATLAKVHLELHNATSFTGTYGLIYQHTCAESKCHLIDLISYKPPVDMALFYDTSTGSTGINAVNTQSKLETIALNSSSGQDVKTYLLNTSVDMFNEKNDAEITAKTFDVTQTGSEAAINVFGDASVKVVPNGETNAKKIEANAVELTANGGAVNMNVGAVKTDVSNADNVIAEGVKITAENNTEGRFTSGRQWYYHVNKWEQKGDESLVVDPDNLDKNNELTFTVKSKVIENTDSYNITRFKNGYIYDGKTYDIYFLENESTGEILYVAQNTTTGSDDNYYEAILTAGTYKQCEPAYPGDITVSAAGKTITAYGAQLTAKDGNNAIHFETTNGGGISVNANGSDGTAYGLYTDSAGGTINALIEGSITESGISGADLGDTAGIALDGSGGTVSIQVGVKPTEPPVGTKEVIVSGSRIGIYNKSGIGQEKNIVIFGTVTGDTAPILSDVAGDSSFTLAAWAIDLKNGNAAFTNESGTLAADTAFEKNIRYILLTDPSAADTVTIESAGTDEARAIKENENIGTIRGYCASDFDGGYGINLRDKKADFYIQNLKENTETYSWAKAGDTVTVKSKEEGYYITEAYWREGTGEDAKMDCSGGSCTFTVPTGGGVWIHGIELKPLISQDVTFKVANGEWNNGGSADITVTVSGLEGDTLTLAGVTIPQAGERPATTYKPGSWDNEPTASTVVDADHNTFTYSYIPKEAVSQLVTFKVVNGAWNDGWSADITVTVSGLEGDTLTLAGVTIPQAGEKPANTYKAGGWDVVPTVGTVVDADHNTFTYSYIPKEAISQLVTFKVMNGEWNNGGSSDITVTVSGLEGDTLTLAGVTIPQAGEKPADTYKAGGWDVVPTEGTVVDADHNTFTYSYIPKEAISQIVTFKVVNGSWNNGGSSDITVTVSGLEGDTLTLAGVTIPQAGEKPANTYKPGSWDNEPTASTVVDADHNTFTYSYIPKEAISQLVTFKVINGAWNDGTTADKIVTLTGYEGDTLKLLPADIPAVGEHPDAGYTSGAWDVIPDTETAITSDTVYTYTYEKHTPDEYKTVRGENQDFKIGSGQDAVFEIKRVEEDRLTYQKFIHKVELKSSKSDYRIVDPQNYDYEEGSLIIKLHADYLNTLLPDHYTLKVYFEDGIDEIPFTISKDNDRPPFPWLPCEECELPNTGFSAAHATNLQEQPKKLNSSPLYMRLQIPTLNEEIEMVTIPRSGNSWDVQWLGDHAGLMEGFALPGEGYSLLAAHNTLSETEYGPFALLSMLEVNDLITANDRDGSMKLFRVYANELLEPDDMLKLAEIAEQEANSLVLITCENESVSGGYHNRRVVFAKQLQ